MATYKGKEGTIKVGDSFIAEVRSFELTATANEVDTSTMGSDWTGVDSTQRSWSGTCEMFYDHTDAGQQAVVVGEKVAIEFYPTGETTGNPIESGSALVTSITRPQAHDNIIQQTVEFTGDGALTRGSVT